MALLRFELEQELTIRPEKGPSTRMPVGSRICPWLRAAFLAALIQLTFGLVRTLVAVYADLPSAEQALFLVERGPGFIVAFPIAAVVSRASSEPILMLRQLIYPASAIATWLIYSAALWWLLRRGPSTPAKLGAVA